jgi:hypothetical protein
MASIITATTTSGLTQSADNSGVLQLASGTGNLVTVPAVTGTAMVSGNMPAFSAWKSSSQSYSASTWTKVTFDTEEYDTANCFASSTFTPNVAGYYICTARIQIVADGTAMQEIRSAFYKNGTIFKQGNYIYIPATTVRQMGMVMSAVIYCNGSTDYVEVYGNSDGSTLTFLGVSGNASSGYFQATMIRGA